MNSVSAQIQTAVKEDPKCELSIIGGIAAHFTSPENFAVFCKCLISVANQSTKLRKVCISWSAENGELFDQIVNVLNKYISAQYEHFVFLPHQGRLQQFQHYKRIEEHYRIELGFGTEAWIMFGDSDDEWANDRVEFMSNELKKCLAADNKSVLVFNWKGVMEDGILWNEEPDQNGSWHPYDFEYWMTIVRFDLFSEFFEQAHPYYLSSAWCDLAFDAYLHKHEPDIAYIRNANGWKNYLYLKNGQGSHIAGMSDSGRIMVCKFLEHEMMENFPDALTAIPKWNSYVGGPLFALKKTVTVSDMEIIKENPDLNESLLPFIRPICCNKECSEHGQEDVQLLLCRGCRVERYCSKGCQKKCWKEHKVFCREFGRTIHIKNSDIFSESYCFGARPGFTNPT